MPRQSYLADNIFMSIMKDFFDFIEHLRVIEDHAVLLSKSLLFNKPLLESYSVNLYFFFAPIISLMS